MANTCNVLINGRSVRANIGESLIDAGLSGWIAIPHDCCSGQCDTCRVEVVGGSVDDQGTADGRTVLACQSTVIGPAEIRFDEVPAMSKRNGLVTEITRLSPDVMEVVVSLDAAINYRPGQYLNVKFSGFPGRDLSPALRADGSQRDRELVFHMRKYPGGLVSTQVGATIREGHRVQVRGPFGYAFLREGSGPIVLVSGGTGWAPMWSIARAARREQPHRELMVIAGARGVEDLYMRRSLQWLIDDGVREVIATAEKGFGGDIRGGFPTHYLPSLGLEDTVFVAGPPGLVDAVKRKARAAAARCYADPFLPGEQKLTLIDRVMQMLNSRDGRIAPEEIIAPAAAGLGSFFDRLGGRRIERQTAAGIVRPFPRARRSSRRAL